LSGVVRVTCRTESPGNLTSLEIVSGFTQALC
jgi:hypothetical protein